jgi:hypothetical protein
MDQIKQCTKCGRALSLENFYRDSKSGDGRRARCKACENERKRQLYADPDYNEAKREYSRQYRAEHSDKVREKNREYYAANTERLREYNRQHYAANAESRRERQRQYYAANPDQERERSSQYRAEHPDKMREYSHRFYVANAEKVRERSRQYHAENKDKARNRKDKYYQTPEGKASRRAGTSRRRARRRAAPGRGVTAADIRTIIAGQTDKNGRVRCWWCNGVIDGDNFHIDHRIALANGGAHDPANCCVSCPTCNISKSVKGPEWAGRLL